MPPLPPPRSSPPEVFWIFLRLGLSSFGGPAAHLGYFHTELVVLALGLLRTGGPGLLTAVLVFGGGQTVLGCAGVGYVLL